MLRLEEKLVLFEVFLVVRILCIDSLLSFCTFASGKRGTVTVNTMSGKRFWQVNYDHIMRSFHISLWLLEDKVIECA